MHVGDKYQILGRISVLVGRTGEGTYTPDAGCITNIVGDREPIERHRLRGDEWPGREWCSL